MEKLAQKYLENAFSDLLDYTADDPLQPINPLTYSTPEGDTCLHIAAGRGDLKAVKFLFDASLDINLSGDLGNTALHYVRMRGHDNVVEFLVGPAKPRQPAWMLALWGKSGIAEPPETK